MRMCVDCGEAIPACIVFCEACSGKLQNMAGPELTAEWKGMISRLKAAFPEGNWDDHGKHDRPKKAQSTKHAGLTAEEVKDFWL